MSIFPTKILVATDGSKEADLAARTATELADKTGSELHLVHVFGITPWYPAYPEGGGFGVGVLENPVLEEAKPSRTKIWSLWAVPLILSFSLVPRHEPGSGS